MIAFAGTSSTTPAFEKKASALGCHILQICFPGRALPQLRSVTGVLELPIQTPDFTKLTNHLLKQRGQVQHGVAYLSRQDLETIHKEDPARGVLAGKLLNADWAGRRELDISKLPADLQQEFLQALEGFPEAIRFHYRELRSITESAKLLSTLAAEGGEEQSIDLSTVTSEVKQQEMIHLLSSSWVEGDCLVYLNERDLLAIAGALDRREAQSLIAEKFFGREGSLLPISHLSSDELETLRPLLFAKGGAGCLSV